MKAAWARSNRATDTKLNRDVALKILPEQFASDSQRMGRFQREAEVLASLDHPNIGQIYGIEEAGATKALVLQLIEGPTLAEKIAQGPISRRGNAQDSPANSGRVRGRSRKGGHPQGSQACQYQDYP